MGSLFRYLLVFCFGALGLKGMGQEFPMLHYTYEDGLPGNTVYQIYRDTRGFLWIGTNKGVARYNGVRFEKFTTFDGLSDNEIYFFREDYSGRLWIGAANGKLCYFRNDTFYSEKNDPMLKLSRQTSHIGFISIEPDSSVTICFYGDIIFLNISGNRIKEFDLSKIDYGTFKMPYSNIRFPYKRKLAPDRYALYFNGGNIVMDTNYKVRSFTEGNYSTGFRPTFSQTQEYELNDHLFYGPVPMVNVLGRLPSYLQTVSRVYTIYHDSSNYFFTTSKGLLVNDTLVLLKDHDVSSITQDVTGNYWVSTIKDGIFCIRKDFLNTRLFRNAYDKEIRYCKTIGGRVFFVTNDNNLHCLQGEYVKTIFDYRQFKRTGYIEPNDAAYLLDEHNNYYSFYNEENIVIHDISSPRPLVSRFVIPRPLWSMKSLISDGKDIFLKTREGIAMIDYTATKNGDTLRWHGVSDTTNTERIAGLAKDKDNAIWYSKINGMFTLLNGKCDTFPGFSKAILKSFEFLGDDIVGYTFDGDPMVIRRTNGKVRIDSIKSERIAWLQLYKLNDSMLLVSTSSFYRLVAVHHDYQKDTVTISVIEDPFLPLNIDGFCSDDSNCYFLKNGGITAVSTKILFAGKNKPPALFFTLLKTANKIYRLNEELELPYYESKNITVSFATISFAGNSVAYQYSFTRNDDENWIDVKGDAINLVNPGYGNYVMKIRAKTLNSQYGAPVALTLRILKPYWATWWFIVLCICFATALTGVAIRYRIRYLLHKRERLHEDEIKYLKLEYKALNALMNPHFIFNALNNMQALINKNEKLAANKYLGIFADLIRQNMHNISLELISLQKEMEIVENYLKLEKLRFKELLNYKIYIAEDVDLSEVMIPPLLVQPLVENSIKHGIFPRKSTESFVGIDVFERDNLLVIAVRDNGVGMEVSRRNSEENHQSYGLDNIRKRIAQLALIQNKKITLDINEIRDDTGKLQWTVVSISISLS